MVSRGSLVALCAGAWLMVAGCSPSSTATPPTPADAKTAASAASTKTAPAFVAAGGEKETLAPLAQDDPAKAAFGVVKFNDFADISDLGEVRLLGTAGGDPAMNGLMTYLAFVSPHDDAGFLIGNFRDYRVAAAARGRIDLEIDEDIMNDAGEPTQRTRRVIISWVEKPQASSPNPEFPSTVTITPAR